MSELSEGTILTSMTSLFFRFVIPLDVGHQSPFFNLMLQYQNLGSVMFFSKLKGHHRTHLTDYQPN